MVLPPPSLSPITTDTTKTGEETGAECSGCKDGVDGCAGEGYCVEGLYCCNASCGTCVETGMLCTMQYCEPETETYPTKSVETEIDVFG